MVESSYWVYLTTPSMHKRACTVTGKKSRYRLNTIRKYSSIDVAATVTKLYCIIIVHSLSAPDDIS